MMNAHGGGESVAVQGRGAAEDGEAGMDLLLQPDGFPNGAPTDVAGADSADSLPLLRHSAAHLLAAAVRALRPEAGIGFGPAIEDGFYYDFAVDRPFTPEDLAAFEAKMRELAAADDPFERREVSRDEARALFADDPLKLERLEEIGDGETISVYRNGAFVDLCRGPHVPSTGRIRHVRLLSAAGAYWRGDERRQMLQRIYGTAWWSAEQLAAHLARLEEARRRDHRVLGQALDLFSVDARIGPGLILWHPRGTVIRGEVERWERELVLRHGYDMVSTPHLVGEAMFEQSGHLESYAEGMWGPVEMDGRRYRPKPMNCPGHIAIYKNRVRSYRELPLRWAEFGAGSDVTSVATGVRAPLGQPFHFGFTRSVAGVLGWYLNGKLYATGAASGPAGGQSGFLRLGGLVAVLHRRTAAPALEVSDLALGEIGLAGDAVEWLELPLLALAQGRDEAEEGLRLARHAEFLQDVE